MTYEPDEGDAGLEALLAQRRTPRQRIARVALVFGVVLTLILLLGGLPTLRRQAISPVSSTTPTMSTHLQPQDADEMIYYLDTNLPDMVVTLDGHAVPPSELEAQYPFHLAYGHHRVSWQAGPFTAQSCTFSLPRAPGDTCQRTYGTGARHIFAEPSGNLVQIHVSLLTLATDRQQSLLSALHLATSDLSEVVQPGESYFTAVPISLTADRPLRATLQVQLDLSLTTPSTFMPACVFSRDGSSISPCLASVTLGACTALCILPFSDSASDFLALAPVELRWDYTTLDGQSAALGQMIGIGGAATSVHYGLFHVTWDGAHWHATLLSGPNLGAAVDITGLKIATDLACVAAMDAYFGAAYARNGASEVRFHSAPNPAAGCLITTSVRQAPSHPTSVTLLDRFGILYAVGDAAHRLEPLLPVAQGTTLTAADQLARYPGQAVKTEPLGVTNT